jgi:hypothetical protein
MEEVIRINTRIDGCEHITKPPSIFFTIANGNPTSVQIVRKLGELHNSECVVFTETSQINAHLIANEIPDTGAVAIFDYQWQSGYFSPLYHKTRMQMERFPNWAPVLWGISVHHRIPESRILSVSPNKSEAIFT